MNKIVDIFCNLTNPNIFKDVKMNKLQIKYITSIISSFLNEMTVSKLKSVESRLNNSNQKNMPIIDLGNGYKMDLNRVERPEPFDEKTKGLPTQESLTLNDLIDEFIQESTYPSETDNFISKSVPKVLNELLKEPANFKKIQTLSKPEIELFLTKKYQS